MNNDLPSFRRPPLIETAISVQFAPVEGFTNGGARSEALASFARHDEALWRQAIDEMLGWRSAQGRFDEQDQPDEAILEAALDYAVDQVEDNQGAPAPASIVPSGGGRIAMEWNDGPYTVIIEFTGPGSATYTLFNRGRMEGKHLLTL